MKPTVRCSSLDQLFFCHGSRTLQAIARPRFGKESHEGTFLHWRVAYELVKHLGATEPDGGLKKDPICETYKLPKPSEWLLAYFLAHVNETIPNTWALLVELPLAYEFLRFILSGHLDIVAFSPDGTECIACDWKTGYRIVDLAEFNNQVLGYIALLKRAFPSLRKITFQIVQPRASEEAGEQRVSTVTHEGEQLDRDLAYLEAKVNEALDDPMTVNSGICQCAWCPVADKRCPAWWGDFLSMQATLTPELLAKIKAEPDDEMLGELIVRARTLRRPIEDAEELIRERLESVGRINAMGVSITQETRGGKWKVVAPVAMLSAVRAILPDAELAEVVSYSTDRIKDSVAKVLGCPKSGKQAVTADKVFIEKFAPHLEQGVSRILRIA
jgi:hypothetical protein